MQVDWIGDAHGIQQTPAPIEVVVPNSEQVVLIGTAVVDLADAVTCQLSQLFCGIAHCTHARNTIDEEPDDGSNRRPQVVERGFGQQRQGLALDEVGVHQVLACLAGGAGIDTFTRGNTARHIVQQFGRQLLACRYELRAQVVQDQRRIGTFAKEGFVKDRCRPVEVHRHQRGEAAAKRVAGEGDGLARVGCCDFQVEVGGLHHLLSRIKTHPGRDVAVKPVSCGLCRGPCVCDHDLVTTRVGCSQEASVGSTVDTVVRVLMGDDCPSSRRRNGVQR